MYLLVSSLIQVCGLLFLGGDSPPICIPLFLTYNYNNHYGGALDNLLHQLPKGALTPSPNYMPAYIASLPIRPSEPTTPAPFTLPMPTPNTMANPTSNYCGYGWESAVAECFHACPSGLDTDCPGGRSCHVSLFFFSY